MSRCWNRVFFNRFLIGLPVLAAILSSLIWAGQTSQISPTSPKIDGTFAGSRDTDPHAQFVDFHEDWNTLSLAGSNLQPQPPVLGVKNDTPGKQFIRELYQVYWRPKDPLDLYIILPRGVKKPPIAMYLYSYPQDINRFENDTWCLSATGGGRFAAIGFVSAMTGPRADSRPLNEWFVSEFQESLATSVHDVQMILNYLTTRGDLDMEHVGMFGQGSGATIAILASAADERIKVVDALAPWGDWPDWIARTSIVPDNDRAKYNNPEFLAKVAKLDPVVWLPKVKAKALLLQDVRKDAAVPDVAEEKMEQAAPEFAEINQYGDRGALYPEARGGNLFAWLQAKLDSNAAPVMAANKSERIHFYPSKPRKDSNPLPMPASPDK